MDRELKAWVGVIAVIALLANVAFFFLSDSYYADKATKESFIGTGLEGVSVSSARFAADLTAARTGFAVLSAVVSLALIVLPLSPRALAYGYTLLLTTGAFIGGIGAFKAGINPLLPITLLIIGTLLGVLSYFAATNRARGAWAFLVGIVGMLAVCTLFGATKIRDSVGVGLWYAMIVPGLCAVATTALLWIRADFDE